MGVAYIGRIIEINPIEGADFIESAVAVVGAGGKWSGTVKRGESQPGDLVEVYLQDALLPNTSQFSFMEKNQFIVRMRRFRGVPSECLIMPLTEDTRGLEVGYDIADIKGVKKYEKSLPANMSGETLGWFPSFVPKIDEPNFQTVPEMVKALFGCQFYSTVKADGSSATVYKYQGHFGCCSRNLELKETPNNAIWKIARKYDLESAMMDGMAVQMEIVGPGIQGNPMGLKEMGCRVFNWYDIEYHKYFDSEYLFSTCKGIGIPTVEIVEWDRPFELVTDEEIRKYAEGLYPNGKQREGVVIRPMTETLVDGNRLSFKAINLLYKG